MRHEMATALCRSVLYDALAVGFRPPGETGVAQIHAPDALDGLVDAAAVVDSGLVPLVRRLAAVAADAASIRTTHARLFGHTARGEVPAFETEYGVGEQVRQPHELADLGGFYSAFGLRVAPAAGERPDHVRCECELMMVLARREALAWEAGDDATRAVVERAVRLFLRDHLGRFAPTLGERLERADPRGFYGALGALLKAVVAGDCRRAGVDAGPASLPLRDPTEDAVPMACGSCDLAGGGDETDHGD